MNLQKITLCVALFLSYDANISASQNNQRAVNENYSMCCFRYVCLCCCCTNINSLSNATRSINNESPSLEKHTITANAAPTVQKIARTPTPHASATYEQLVIGKNSRSGSPIIEEEDIEVQVSSRSPSPTAQQIMDIVNKKNEVEKSTSK